MRKHEYVTINADGRDKGKVFRIDEMSAFAAEEWGARLIFAMGKSQGEIPQDLLDAGAVGIMSLGLRAITGVSFDDAKPLLDEMLTCISFVPDANAPDITRKDYREDIEEPGTILYLRDKVLELHTGFSVAAILSKLGVAAKVQSSLDTQTSPITSESSSQEN